MAIRKPTLEAFPKMVASDCDQTSEIDRLYNCIGWAAGRRQNWWPFPGPPHTFWPDDVEASRSLDAFEAVFAKLGYLRCTSEDLEAGIEKVAFYVDADGLTTHAARQLESGLWTSKLGLTEDIVHPLRQLEGNTYGVVKRIMCRPRPVKPKPTVSGATG